MSLDRSISGKWKEKREVIRKKSPLLLGWVYKVGDSVAMLIKIENNICILITKEGIEFQVNKKDLKSI
jgi:hypothetical protein